MGFILFGVIILLFVLYLRNMYRESLWVSGIFPKRLRYNEGNLMEAYICVAAVILRNDYVHLKEKIQYMSKYFDQYFPESNYEFMESLKYSFENPIKEKSVGIWINRNIKDDVKKSQIIYFIVGLSIIDGRINRRELIFIENLAKSIHMNQTQIDSILSMYRTNYEQSKKDSAPRPKKSAAEYCYSVLELPNNSSKSAVKKAYRKLAKTYHPDRHLNANASDRKVAKERFMQIQKAYDYLNEL